MYKKVLRKYYCSNDVNSCYYYKYLYLKIRELEFNPVLPSLAQNGGFAQPGLNLG